MNKHIWAALCLTVLPSTLSAERKPLVLSTYAGYYVSAVSPNGQWATGTYEGGDELQYAFRWNLTTGQIELLSTNGDESSGNSISDDGVVACTFYDPHASANGAPAKSGGVWNGSFQSIESIGGQYAPSRDGSTRALAITADHAYVAGTSLNEQGVSVPTVWNDGKLLWYPTDGIEGYAQAVSADGQLAAGWSTPPSAHGARVSTLWNKDGSRTYLSDPDNGSPWSYARSFTPDGSKLLYWRDYDYPVKTTDLTGPMAIYDVKTGQSTAIYTMTADPFNIEMNAIANDGTTVGYEQPNEGVERATIAKGNKTEWLEDYLKENGVDLTQVADLFKADDGTSYLTNAMGISADGQVIVVRYYDTEGYTRSVAFNLNYEHALREPVQLQASQLAGTRTVKLEWLEPTTEADQVKSYHVYRDGNLVGTVNKGTLTCYDEVPAWGDYDYTVSAVYETGESNVSSKVSASVKEQSIAAPQQLWVRQARLNDARLQWERPASNLINKRYYEDDMLISGFGAGTYSFEGAVRYEKDDLAFYKGRQLRAVAFYPMSEQKSFTLNIYKKGANDEKPQLLATQPISQALTYGQRNTVKLTQPLDLPTDADLYVAISVEPASGATDNVLGIVYGLVSPGLADMARQAGEDNFYSIYEQSVASGNPFTFTWAIDALLAAGDTPENVDDVDHYNIYDGENLVETTTATQAEIKGLADGIHSLGVESVYADGRVSGRTSAQLEVKANAAYYKSVEQVQVSTVSETTVKFAWEAPLDDDATLMTYAGNQTGASVVGPEANNYAFQAATDYPAEKLKGYEGYQIKSLRFYPQTECEFTLSLLADGQVVATEIPDDYTTGQWNEVKLSDPVTVENGKSYRLIVDCYDVGAGEAPLGLDNQVPFVGQADLYSVDDGANFSSVYSAGTGVEGNWMVGLNLVSPDANALPVTGYRVSVDGKEVQEYSPAETTCEYDFKQHDELMHNVRVDAIYDTYGSVRGGVTYFRLGIPSGIGETAVTAFHLQTSEGILRVEGADVAALTAYATDGRQVGQAQGARLRISNYASGTYVLDVLLTDGTRRSCKFVIKR